MLATIRGKIILKELSAVIVDTHDIGYRVFVVPSFLASAVLEEPVLLFLYHHVREQGAELYGFSTHEEYTVFSHLVSVSGVGPKTALQVFALAPVRDIVSAIGRGDADLLKKVSGIGTKTAERIVVELKSKFQFNAIQNPSSPIATEDEDIIDALVRLGYAAHEARIAVRESDSGHSSTPEEKLKRALRHLSV